MAWPSTYDTFAGTAAQGSSLVVLPDHAQDHRALGSFAGTAEHVIGLGIGTPIANSFLQGIGGGSSQWATTGTALAFASSTFNNGTISNSQIAGSANLAAGTFTSPQVNGTVTSVGTVNGLIFGVTIAPGVGTIVDSAGGTQVVNAQAANIYYSAQGTSAGNRTIGTPSNPQPYQQLTYAYKASGSANGTLVWSPIFRLSQDSGTPALGTGTTWNYFGWRYNAIDSKWDFMGQSKNIV